MTITIKIDKERLSKMVTVDEYLSMLDGDVRSMVNVLSNAVIGEDGDYLDQKEGRKIIGKLTLDEMKDAVGAFTDSAEGIAVPPSSGAV